MRDSGLHKRGNARQNARYYVDGSAARKLNVYDGIEHEEHALNMARRRRIIKAAPMNMAYIMVMALALMIVCGVLMSYVKLQSDITNHVKNISALESRLNSLRLENDETYTKIMSSVDLEEIKRIAVNELGMKYAKEGQVVKYTGEGNDYVRQYSEIPK